MIIFIEGADAVGKTTLGESLAKKLGCKFIDSPIKELIEDRVSDFDVEKVKKILVTLFYFKDNTQLQIAVSNAISLIHLSEKYKDGCVVVVRGLPTSFMWNGDEETYAFFEFLAKRKIGVGLNIFLDCEDDVRLQRMLNRGLDEPEVRAKKVQHFDLEPMYKFCEINNIKLNTINTNNLDKNQVLLEAMKIVNKEKICAKKAKDEDEMVK